MNDKLDLWQARELRDDAMSASIAASDDDWKSTFNAELARLAASGQPFTSETITQKVGMPHKDGSKRNNLVGAMMSAAVKTGLIKKLGYRQAEKSRTHGAILAVWQGVNL